MISIADLLIGGLLPAAVAALALSAAWRLTGSATTAWVAGFVCGYLSGHWGLDVRGAGVADTALRALRPHEARDWLPVLLVVFSVPEIVTLSEKRGRVVAWPLRAAACAFLPWRLLSLHRDYPTSELVTAGLSEEAFSWADVFLGVSGFALGMLVLWRAALAAQDQAAPVCRSLLVMAVAIGLAVIVALSGSLTTGQLIGVVAAAVGGSGVAAVLLRICSGPEAASGPLLAAVGGLFLVAHLFIEGGIDPLVAALLGVSLVAALSGLPKSERVPRCWQTTVRSAICLVPLVVAVALAGWDFAATQSLSAAEPQGNPYLNWQR